MMGAQSGLQRGKKALSKALVFVLRETYKTTIIEMIWMYLDGFLSWYCSILNITDCCRTICIHFCCVNMKGIWAVRQRALTARAARTEAGAGHRVHCTVQHPLQPPAAVHCSAQNDLRQTLRWIWLSLGSWGCEAASPRGAWTEEANDLASSDIVTSRRGPGVQEPDIFWACRLLRNDRHSHDELLDVFCDQFRSLVEST